MIVYLFFGYESQTVLSIQIFATFSVTYFVFLYFCLILGHSRHFVDPQILPSDPVQVAQVLSFRVLWPCASGAAGLPHADSDQPSAETGPHAGRAGAGNVSYPC